MQISKDKLKLIRLQRISLFVMGASLFLQFQIGPSTKNGLSPFNQIFLLTKLQSKILLKNTISETSEINFDSLAISQDGQTIISRNTDKTIKVRDFKTGKLINTITGNADESGRMVISPDGQLVASNSKNGIQIKNLKTGLLKTTIPYKDKAGVSNFFFSADGQTLVSKGFGDVIEIIFDQKKADADPMFHKNKKDKNNDTIEIWDVNTGKLKTTLSCENCVENLFAVSPDGQTIVSSGHLVSYYDLPTRKMIWSNTIRIWDVSTGKVKTALTNTTDFNKSIDTLTISPDGQTFVTRSERKIIKIWDMNTGNLKATLPNPDDNDIDSILFSPDGHTLFTSNGGSVKIWNLKTGLLKNTLDHSGLIGAFAISRDGQTLVSKSIRSLIIWDLKTGKYKTTLINPDPNSDGYSPYFYSVSISPDGQTIVSSNWNSDKKQSTIKTWQMP